MGQREGLIEAGLLIRSDQELSEGAIIQLKRQEHDYLIARVGLQGTLWGAWACLVVIVLIVISPVFTQRNVIEGWQVVAVVVSMVAAIVYYGTFIFRRALNASGKVAGVTLEVAAPPMDQPAIPAITGLNLPMKTKTGATQ